MTNGGASEPGHDPEHEPEPQQPLDVVIFDLGGVLVRLRGLDNMRRLSGIDTDEAVMQRWLACPWVRRFESGQCTPDEFAGGIIADWGLAATSDVFLETFRGWPESLFEGATELVTETSGVCVAACLSNTNALHWEMQAELWSLDTLFDEVFLSYELGLVKPDADIFRHVTGVLGVAPERTLLLDDNQPNVDGARSIGMQAVLVRGPTEARHELVRLGVLGARPSD
jgi:glucose-1-phosphatase